MREIEKVYDYENGFSLGLTNLKFGQVDAFKERLQEVLLVTTRQAVDNYIWGKTIITEPKAKAIEKVFRDFGITNPDDIWGIGKTTKTRLKKDLLTKANTIRKQNELINS